MNHVFTLIGIAVVAKYAYKKVRAVKALRDENLELRMKLAKHGIE